MFCIAKHGTSRVYKIHLANKLAVEKKMILKDAIYIYMCVCVYIYIYIYPPLVRPKELYLQDY